MKTLTILAGLLLAARLVNDAVASPPPMPQQTGDICADAVAAQEKVRGVPDRLLAAISMVESGRWDEKTRAGIAWPWTVTSGGSGKFFPTKAAAIAEVRRLQEKGVRNIDVGCMQVNLMYHPEAFADLEEAFDPTANAAYAADFLARLYEGAGSWLQAAASYHSMEPQRASYYRQKVVKAWNESTRGQAAPKRGDGDDAGDDIYAGMFDPVTSAPPTPKPIKSRNPARLDPIQTVTNEQLMQATIASHAEQAARVQGEREAARAFAANWRQERLRAYEERKSLRTARNGAPAQRL
ncbi:MAG: transglycosylase SLT domain-containing protein [Alphaproteobacteria bacterium]|nr:transglycosylase SLT domain-containing protein [Alphaproteobacteria bacterium]